jgi:hypothetical protein
MATCTKIVTQNRALLIFIKVGEIRLMDLLEEPLPRQRHTTCNLLHGMTNYKQIKVLEIPKELILNSS